MTQNGGAQISIRSRSGEIPPPEGMDPMVAQFIAELARAAVRRQNRTGKATGETPEPTGDRE